MNRTEIYAKLTEVFRDVFDDESIELKETTTAADIEDWDSLTHIMLLSAVEDDFGIKFDMKAVQGLKDVGAMVSSILSSSNTSRKTSVSLAKISVLFMVVAPLC